MHMLVRLWPAWADYRMLLCPMSSTLQATLSLTASALLLLDKCQPPSSAGRATANHVRLTIGR